VTGATKGLIDNGSRFRPDDAINQSEVAKLIALAREVMR